MSCDIDEHITSKYDIKKRVGKGVGTKLTIVGLIPCMLVCVAMDQLLCPYKGY